MIINYNIIYYILQNNKFSILFSYILINQLVEIRDVNGLQPQERTRFPSPSEPGSVNFLGIGTRA